MYDPLPSGGRGLQTVAWDDTRQCKSKFKTGKTIYKRETRKLLRDEKETLNNYSVSCQVVLFNVAILNNSKTSMMSCNEYYLDIFLSTFFAVSTGLSKFKGSKDFGQVTEAYYHAVTGRYPQAYYRVGWDAKTVFTLLINLPTGVTDYLIARSQTKPAGARWCP